MKGKPLVMRHKYLVCTIEEEEEEKNIEESRIWLSKRHTI